MKVKLFFSSLLCVLAAFVFASEPSDFLSRVDGSGADQAVVIIGYVGKSKAVVIPSEINGIPVKIIGESAFKLKGLTSVSLPASLEKISKYAFYGNRLDSIDIPAGVRVIDASAFDSNLLIKMQTGSVAQKEPANNAVVQKEKTARTAQTTQAAQIIEMAPLLERLYQQPETYYPLLGEYPLADQMKTVHNQSEITSFLVTPISDKPLKSALTRTDYYEPLAGEVHNSTVSTVKIPVNTYSPVTNSAPVPTNSTPVENNGPIANSTPVENNGPGANSGSVENNGPIANSTSVASGAPVVSSAPVVNNDPALKRGTPRKPAPVSDPRAYTIGYDVDRYLVIKSYSPIKAETAIEIPSSWPDGTPVGIGRLAFRSKALQSVIIPSNISFIDECAFMSNSLTEIVFPDSIRYIGRQAFDGNNLTSITIGSNVDIEPDSFSYRFVDYYNMAGKRAGTYIFKAGQWDLNGIERVDYNVIRKR